MAFAGSSPDWQRWAGTLLLPLLSYLGRHALGCAGTVILEPVLVSMCLDCGVEARAARLGCCVFYPVVESLCLNPGQCCWAQCCFCGLHLLTRQSLQIRSRSYCENKSSKLGFGVHTSARKLFLRLLCCSAVC